jgi:site-specific recombinase XerC
MARRAPGEGGIYPIHDAEGKIVKYGGSVELGYVNGRRRRKKIERRTRRDVAEEIARLKAQIARGADLTSKQPTVKAYCDAWLDNTFALSAKPKSVETYRQALIYHVYPRFGATKINKVTHRMAQALIAELHQNDYADKTISLVRATGRQAYAAAMKEGLADHNPFQELTLPTGNTKVVSTLTVAQARALMLALRGDRLELALRLMLSLGLRRGEVCGLRWESDVDLDAGTLTVHGTLQYVRGSGLVWGARRRSQASGRSSSRRRCWPR